MERFSVRTEFDVRWRDTDALGHVNNAVYFTYMEMGRIAFMRDVFGQTNTDKIDFILASAACDFHASLYCGDHVEVGLRVTGLGRTSFDFDYEIRRLADGVVAAKGRSTQVMFDYENNCKIPIPDTWVKRVELAQGETLPRSDEADSF